MKNVKGFTLIELLVVIAIIGILSTVAMASFGSAQKKARDAQRRSDLSQIKSALEMARSDDASSYYPDSGSTPAVTNFATLKTYLEGKGYIKVVPEDPKEGSWSYYYTPSTPATDYTLAACLENPNDSKKDTNTYSECTVAKGKFDVSVTLVAP